MERTLPGTWRLSLTWRTYALAVALGLGVGFALYQLTAMGFDGDAYWNAALRLRDGSPLYQPGAPNDPLVYRYPAWFASAWAPLTYLPHELVMTVWRLAMVAAAMTLVPLWRDPWGRVGVALFVPALITAGWMGNAQPLVVALAVYGVRSSQPVALGVAAGIKGLPFALVGVYLWRRQWAAATVALVVGGLLWLTVLPYLSGWSLGRPPWPTDLALVLAFVRPSVGTRSPSSTCCRTTSSRSSWRR